MQLRQGLGAAVGGSVAWVVVRIVFETHSWSEDNELGIASGWRHSRLSERGRDLAAELGARRSGDGIAAVFTSDLCRAVETAEIAMGESKVPIFHDWRLRECNYGTGNGMAAAELHQDKRRYLTARYPGGESWTGAVERVGWFLRDLSQTHDQHRVLVIGHVATRWGFQHHLEGRPLAELIAAGFDWQLGWEYDLTSGSLA